MKPIRTRLLVGVLLIAVLVIIITLATPRSFKPDLCPPISEQMNIANQIAISRKPRGAYYDEQLTVGLGSNATALSYNVTAIAQNDTYGFGPLYSLNGWTQMNVWYQVGLTWNWGYNNEEMHLHGFRFFYQVWNTTSKRSMFPNAYGTTEAIAFRKPVRSGDIVLLSLRAMRGEINMSAYDWESNASESTSFPSYGASGFLGSPKPTGFATSLMTEWYHVLPFFCTNQAVVYSNKLAPVSSGWLQIGEWNFTGIPTGQWFNAADRRQNLFNSYSSCPLAATPVPFEANGTRIYANATDFWTM